MNKLPLMKIGLVFCVGISLAANLFLVKTARQSYTRMLLSKLDPAGMRVYPPVSIQDTKDTILFLGDSRIALWNPLPEIDGVNLINRGIAGQTTSEILFRIDKDCLAHQPKVVVIEAGINDLKAIGFIPEQKKEIVDQCIINLTQILQQLSSRNIPVVLLTVIPPGRMGMVRRSLWSKEIDDAIAAVNAALKTLENKTIVVVDSGLLLGDGRRVRQTYSTDDFHINASGYIQINQAIMPCLQSFMKEQKEYAIQ
jgi:lysophospholipase L1-like esterase